MRNVSRGISSIIVMALLAPAVMGDEEKVPLDKLPQKVVDAVKTKFPDGRMIKASKEKEDNETIYEVALKDKDQNIDVSLKEDGTIIDIEKEIKIKDLPKVVTDALEGKYPKATHKKAEEVIKKDKLEYYEVVVETAEKKKFEVQVSPEGKILKEEGKEAKKDTDKSVQNDSTDEQDASRGRVLRRLFQRLRR
jgi:hypothetical protein